MAQFSTQEAAALASIQQVLSEWGNELDVNSGAKLRERRVLTGDCRYFVAGAWLEGIGAIETHYRDRLERLGKAGGAQVMRHILSNMRVAFTDEDEALVEYLLLFFAHDGTPPIAGYCDPLAVADVQMKCRREGDGHRRYQLSCNFGGG